jgi:hypothetical protein
VLVVVVLGVVLGTVVFEPKPSVATIAPPVILSVPHVAETLPVQTAPANQTNVLYVGQPLRVDSEPLFLYTETMPPSSTSLLALYVKRVGTPPTEVAPYAIDTFLLPRAAAFADSALVPTLTRTAHQVCESQGVMFYSSSTVSALHIAWTQLGQAVVATPQPSTLPITIAATVSTLVRVPSLQSDSVVHYFTVGLKVATGFGHYYLTCLDPGSTWSPVNINPGQQDNAVDPMASITRMETTGTLPHPIVMVLWDERIYAGRWLQSSAVQSVVPGAVPGAPVFTVQTSAFTPFSRYQDIALSADGTLLWCLTTTGLEQWQLHTEGGDVSYQLVHTVSWTGLSLTAVRMAVDRSQLTGYIAVLMDQQHAWCRIRYTPQGFTEAYYYTRVQLQGTPQETSSYLIDVSVRTLSDTQVTTTFLQRRIVDSQTSHRIHTLLWEIS